MRRRRPGTTAPPARAAGVIVRGLAVHVGLLPPDFVPSGSLTEATVRVTALAVEAGLLPEV